MRNNLLFAAASLVALCGSAVAQSGSVTPQHGFIQPDAAPRTDVDTSLPRVPRVVITNPTVHDVSPNNGLAVPEGPDNGLPQPDSPPAVLAGGPGNGFGTDAPCDIDFFVNQAIDEEEDVGTGLICEPSVSACQDVAFATGNTYASRSTDSGMTWETVDFSIFGEPDGAVCCDQRTLYIPSRDITVWFIQYRRSNTTMLGGQRIAIANGRADIAAGSNGSWHSWYFRPTNFNEPTGRWLDFPDIAYSNGYLFCSSNVFDFSSNFQNAVVWRMDLDDLVASGGLPFQYVKRTGMGTNGAGGVGGATYRFTQNATSVMYFASTFNSTTIRTYRWPDSGNAASVTFQNRAVPQFQSNFTATDATGTNWVNRINTNIGTRVLGGYRTPDEYGFLWHCGNDPANNRPHCFFRVLRLRTSNDSVIGTNDVWSTTTNFVFPCAAVASDGDIGVTFHAAANGSDPRTSSLIVSDSCISTWGGQSIRTHKFPNSGPSSALWGDYLSMQRHPESPNTFVAASYSMDNGTTASFVEPRYVWFGHEEDTPDTVALNISSEGVNGVPITVSTQDLNAQNNGSTPFTREYARNQNYRVTAPLTYTTGGVTYRFCNWRFFSTNQPDGQRTLARDIQLADDNITAVYSAQRTIRVRSSNPTSGVAITVSEADLFSRQNGSTSFDRIYKNGTSVTLTAPAAAGRNLPFERWVIDGRLQAIGQRTISLTANGTRTATARFLTYTPGRYIGFGRGCVGSNGLIPTLSGSGTPDINTTASFRITNAFPFSSGVLSLGVSNQLLGGITPLPIPLSLIGMGNDCFLFTSIDLTLPFGTDSLGRAAVTLPLANDPVFVGASLYFQGTLLDLAVPTPTKLTVSNALEMQIGGAR